MLLLLFLLPPMLVLWFLQLPVLLLQFMLMFLLLVPFLLPILFLDLLLGLFGLFLVNLSGNATRQQAHSILVPRKAEFLKVFH